MHSANPYDTRVLRLSKKVSKKVKKGVDKPLKEWYYSQARSSGTPLERAPNLENDTETRNAKRQSIT